MYFQVASKLVVASGDRFSQAVSMAGGNAVLVDLTLYNGGTCKVYVQEGNDLQNWLDVDTTPATLAIAEYETLKKGTIAAQYVRLRYEPTTGTCVLAAGINVANL